MVDLLVATPTIPCHLRTETNTLGAVVGSTVLLAVEWMTTLEGVGTTVSEGEEVVLSVTMKQDVEGVGSTMTAMEVVEAAALSVTTTWDEDEATGTIAAGVAPADAMTMAEEEIGAMEGAEIADSMIVEMMQVEDLATVVKTIFVATIMICVDEAVATMTIFTMSILLVEDEVVATTMRVGRSTIVVVLDRDLGQRRQRGGALPKRSLRAIFV